MPVEINSRVLDYEGRQVYFSIIRDITERKRAEAALRESEERLRLALSAAKQGLYDLNVQTGDAVVTPEYARMLGYAPEEFIETNAKWIERLYPDDRVPVADTYRAYVSGALPEYRVEFRQRTETGDWKWILSIGKIVEYDASGNPLRMLGTHTDITDRKRAEEERLDLERRLLHAQKLESLGILAGGIAHDFNNLLMAVLGNLDLALRKVSPVSPARANLEQSAQAARRATDLTRQMLAYSGKGRFIVKAMDLSELVDENTHLFRASVARTATLDVRLDRSLPPIEADAGQVQQVIMNLITNASEAIGDMSGTITVATGVQECDAQCLKRSRIEDVPSAGRFVYLEVSDTGCGMNDQTQQRLFDPFFTTKAPGRGLGMSAILGIVRGHGGAIFVESAAGKGTTIRILFPAVAGTRAEHDVATGARAREAAAPAMSGTVLVVDDEEIVRMVCKEMVESLGLQVLTAVDGRDAVDLFTKHADSISHVILDLSMPNMDGMAAFTELVRIKPGIKVILSSGFDEKDSLQRLPGPGPAGFIQKPYSLKNLRDALEKAGAAGA
jgi:PAS domain S-box-containing protein